MRLPSKFHFLLDKGEMYTNYRLETINMFKHKIHHEDINENNHMNMEKNPQRVYYHVPRGEKSFRHCIHILFGAARWGMHKSDSNMDKSAYMALGNSDKFGICGAEHSRLPRPRIWDCPSLDRTLTRPSAGIIFNVAPQTNRSVCVCLKVVLKYAVASCVNQFVWLFYAALEG